MQDEPNTRLRCWNIYLSDITKGVSLSRQQDSGHGSRNLLRVRVRVRVRMKFEMAHAKRERIHAAATLGEKEVNSHESQKTVESKGAPSFESASESSPGTNWLSFSPKTARALARRQPDSVPGKGDTDVREGDAEKRTFDDLEEDLMSSGAEDIADWYRGNGDDNNPYSSMITDPARASRLERRWLTAMSEGKDPYIAARFERCAHGVLGCIGLLNAHCMSRINQYFDGKCTDDEILYRADISRKDLREVLHHYEEYVSSLAVVQRVTDPLAAIATNVPPPVLVSRHSMHPVK